MNNNTTSITQDELKELMEYNPQSGLFTRVKSTKGKQGKTGSLLGSKKPTGYIIIVIKGRNYRAHRLAFLYMTGEFPKHTVDHINNIRDDNRWSNLQDVSQAVNNLLKTGKGYSYKNGKYEANISYGGYKEYLGRYDTAEEANKVYLTRKKDIINNF